MRKRCVIIALILAIIVLPISTLSSPNLELKLVMVANCTKSPVTIWYDLYVRSERNVSSIKIPLGNLSKIVLIQSRNSTLLNCTLGGKNGSLYAFLNPTVNISENLLRFRIIGYLTSKVFWNLRELKVFVPSNLEITLADGQRLSKNITDGYLMIRMGRGLSVESWSYPNPDDILVPADAIQGYVVYYDLDSVKGELVRLRFSGKNWINETLPTPALEKHRERENDRMEYGEGEKEDYASMRSHLNERTSDEDEELTIIIDGLEIDDSIFGMFARLIGILSKTKNVRVVRPNEVSLGNILSNDIILIGIPRNEKSLIYRIGSKAPEGCPKLVEIYGSIAINYKAANYFDSAGFVLEMSNPYDNSRTVTIICGLDRNNLVEALSRYLEGAHCCLVLNPTGR